MKPEPEELQSNAEGSIPLPPFSDGTNGATSTRYLSGPSVYERLEDDEQIHYLLVNEWFGLVEETTSGSSNPNYAPNDDLQSIAAVTDKRILFVIGKESGDEVVSIDVADIVDATVQRGSLSTKIQFETEATNYIFRVRESDSSNPDAVVNYLQGRSTEENATPSDTAAFPDPTSDAAVSPDTVGSDFIANQEQLSEDAASRLTLAAEKLSAVDISNDQFEDSIYALEDAKEELGALTNNIGIESETVLSTTERIETWLEPLRQVRTALADGIRKRLLLERGGTVSADSLEATYESLIEAESIAKKLWWPTTELQEVRKQLEEEVAVSSTEQETPESEFKWQGTSSDVSQRSSFEATSTENGPTDGTSVEPNPIDGLSSELRSELFNLTEVTDEIATQIDSELDSSDINSDKPDPVSGKGADETSEKPSKDDLIKEIEHVSAKLGKRPSKGEFDRNKSLDGDFVYDYFDSWDDAIATADITELSRSDLVDELHRLQSELGFPPISTHINDKGQFTTHDYQREFGSVDKALEAANIDIESFISQRLEEAVSKTDGELTMKDFASSLPYSAGVIYKFYDDWAEAVNSVTTSTAEESDSDIQQNELTEWYELVRNLKNICDIVVEVTPTTEEAETTDPLVQWYQDIKTFYNGSSTADPGYGTQQAEKNPFSVKDYRSEFGNGERTTEFEHVSAKPISPSVKGLLQPHTELDLDDIYLPVGPESNEKFPIIIESEAELRRANDMLNNLPSTPAPANNDSSGGESGGDTGGKPPSDRGLKSVPGVTESMAIALQEAGYQTREDLQEASNEELEAVENVNHQDVLRIKVSVGG